MRNAVLRAFGEWLMTAGVAFVVLEVAGRALPVHGLTLPVIAVLIGAGTLGKLSYSLEKSALRRVRSCRRPASR